MLRVALAAAVLLLGRCTYTPPLADGWPGDARYSTPVETLDAALECRTPLTGNGRAEPVLLVHGTGVTRDQNWGWSYWPALASAGFEVCWVALPGASLNDIQIAAEYVARAVEVMSSRSGEPVDVIGHSQGGLTPRWAIKYFPAGALVDDLISFAAPNHGTAAAVEASAGGRCYPSCWQMRRGSRFLQTLNDGDETPGTVSYTSIYTSGDELVRPAESAALAGAANVKIQDVCPGRPLDHPLLAGDAVTWELAVDALTHPGPADPKRLSPLVCFRLALPGATLDWPAGRPDRSGVRQTTGEPALAPYAQPPALLEGHSGSVTRKRTG